jgi:hypothetical protein
MDNTFSAVKTGRSGGCDKECALTMNTNAYDVSIRWRKNKYGGIINLNYTPTQPNEVIFADKTYKGTGTVSIDFLNHAGFTVDNVEPDAVVHMEFMRDGTKNAEIIHILVPFVVVGEQGSFPITDGSELIHSITNQLKSYQPYAGDPSTQLTDLNMREFIPANAEYYYAISHDGNKYIILRTIQGIKSEDKRILFDELFNIGTSPKWSNKGGTNLDIAKYYSGSQKIKLSDVYKGGSQEGFTGMTAMTAMTAMMNTLYPINTSTQEGFSSKDTDDIYIDCRPVGVDEETKPVTVKHERGSMFSSKDKQMLVSLLVAVVAAIIFSGLIYAIFKVLKTQDKS